MCMQPLPPGSHSSALHIDVGAQLPYSQSPSSMPCPGHNVSYRSEVAGRVVSRSLGPILERSPSRGLPARQPYARGAQQLLPISEVTPTTHRAYQPGFLGLACQRDPAEVSVRGSWQHPVTRTASCPILEGSRSVVRFASNPVVEVLRGASIEECTESKPIPAGDRTGSVPRPAGDRANSKLKPVYEHDDTDASTAAGSSCTLTTSELRDREGSLRSPAAGTLASHRFMVCFCDMATLPCSTTHVTAALGSVNLMSLCGYEPYDICVVMAYASAYFACVTQPANVAKREFAVEETENLLAVCIFVAHCYVFDNNCPLHVWRDMVLKKRCSMNALNQATLHVLRMRSFRLRVSDDNFLRRLKRLLAHANIEDDRSSDGVPC